MKRKIFLTLAALCCVAATFAEVHIIPRPASVKEGKGAFTLTARTPIVAAGELQNPARLFAQAAARLTKGEMPVVATPAKQAVTLAVDPALASEGYTLSAGKAGVRIVGGSAQGVFYGLQSLLQLAVNGQGRIPAVEIEDQPCMGYRGAMMDVCRYYHPVEDVKRFIDIMALHKLNRFHWHLSEDQGWRIEIKKYPKLTEIGSQRKETIIGLQSRDQSTWKFDGKPHGGYYTQDQIREIVAYAAERYIEVIPEIDMPGHMLGALAAYPELGCRGEGYEVWTRWGISDDVLCAGQEKTFEFVENVLAEVLELFPSKYIHIGGDECPKARWKECPRCQKRMAEEGLKNEKELQSYFMHRVQNYLSAHGREIIGWDEILEGGISKSATIMAWRDQNYGTEAARKGNRVIMTPKWNCYFDYSETADPEKYETVCNKRYLPLRQVYRLEPYDRLRPEEWANVIGVQCNVWCEYIPNFDNMQPKILPRMAALAETGWALDRKDYNDFLVRLKDFVRTYDYFGYKYADYVFRNIL